MLNYFILKLLGFELFKFHNKDKYFQSKIKHFDILSDRGKV